MTPLSYPANAAIPSKAEEQPYEEGPVIPELQRTSPEVLGERGSLTPELDQLQKGQDRPLEVSKAPAALGGGSAAGAESSKSQRYREKAGEAERPEEPLMMETISSLS